MGGKISWQLALKVAFHLAPIVPFIQGHIYAGIGGVLFVLMPYIKVKKLSATIAMLEEMAPKPLTAAGEREMDGLRLSLKRWRALTLLRRL